MRFSILNILFPRDYRVGRMDRNFSFEQQRSNQLFVWSCAFCSLVGIGRAYMHLHIQSCISKLIFTDDLLIMDPKGKLVVHSPPPRDPFNVRVMLDYDIFGYNPDYRDIMHFFKSYRSRFVREGQWVGLAMTSGEFARGIHLGDRQNPRMRTIATQVEPQDVLLASSVWPTSSTRASVDVSAASPAAGPSVIPRDDILVSTSTVSTVASVAPRNGGSSPPFFPPGFVVPEFE